MENRFKKLFTLPRNLYCDGFPVIVAAGALLEDSHSGQVIVQLKFHSISKTPIKALKVSLSTYDITGQALEGTVDYQFLDLQIQNGQDFGDNKAILMPSTVTRSFSLCKMTVVFVDGRIQEVGDFLTAIPAVALPSATSLRSALGDDELVKQYQLFTNEQAVYVPLEANGLWLCSCGEWNSDKCCSKCQSEKNKIFASYDIPKLNKMMEARHAAERAEREEQARVAAENTEKQRIAAERLKAERKEKRKKNSKIAGITAAVAVIIIAVSIVTTKIVIPSSRYKNAEELLVSGEYIGAAKIFCELGDYRDAKSKCFESWGNVVARETLSAGCLHTVGLKSDGSVVASGNNSDGECNVSAWSNIVAVSAGYGFTIGLKSDGTVVATGDNDDGQCDVSAWSDIVAISTGGKHTVGLKSDGTVVAVGANDDGQCDVSAWSDIVAISAGDYHTVGLTSSGVLVTAGNNDYNQRKVSAWSDIIAVSACHIHTVGLKSNGTVVATGYNDYGDCDVSAWSDIVAISTGDFYTVGLKSDGTVVAVGSNSYGQCNVSSWSDIVAISAGFGHTVGLKSDGSVVSVGRCGTPAWSDIKLPT